MLRVARPLLHVLSATIVPASITMMTMANVASDIVAGTASSHRPRQTGMMIANAVSVAL
jgi:hypothetical protein